MILMVKSKSNLSDTLLNCGQLSLCNCFLSSSDLDVYIALRDKSELFFFNLK